MCSLAFKMTNIAVDAVCSGTSLWRSACGLFYLLPASNENSPFIFDERDGLAAVITLLVTACHSLIKAHHNS